MCMDLSLHWVGQLNRGPVDWGGGGGVDWGNAWMKTTSTLFSEFSVFSISKVFSKAHSEPVDELNYGYGAHSQAKATNAANAGEKVEPGHLL